MAETVSPPTETWLVDKIVNAGTTAWCKDCDQSIKFQAQKRNRYVIVNVYVEGRWDHVETWHPDCYVDAGQPHGAPAVDPKMLPR